MIHLRIPRILSHWDHRRLLFVVSCFIAAIVWAAYGQTLKCGFVNLDDPFYVYENASVTGGVTFRGISDAFTQADLNLWTPMTRLSHMFDCHLYELNPWGHHLTNLLLHCATAILLFLWLEKITGKLWRSAFVSALFAVHPLHVESVAWISERKDVLSGLFFILTLWAYWRYARVPFSVSRYLAVLLFYALGLLAKQMLVTLPFLFLLLDYWPLNRIFQLPADTRFIPKQVILEKIPLLLLSALSIGQVLFDPFSSNTLSEAPTVYPPLFLRIENALISYVVYIWKMFCPTNLAIRYPFPIGGIALWKAGMAFLLLCGISLAVYRARRSRPCFLIGWLWYLGMLLPVIGIKCVGGEARCDRYTYLPSIGLSLFLTWAVADLAGASRFRQTLAGIGAAASLIVLIGMTQTQAAYWKDGEALGRHAIACNGSAVITEYNLAMALFEKGKFDEAIVHYQVGIQIQPQNILCYNNMAVTLREKGDLAKSIAVLKKALSLDAANPKVLFNLGSGLLETGAVEEAIVHLRKATALAPQDALFRSKLAEALLESDHLDEAFAACQSALALQPGDAMNFTNLGTAFFNKGEIEPAIVQYRKALQLDPRLFSARQKLAWLMATSNQPGLQDPEKALQLAISSTVAGGKDGPVLRTLAAAYANADRFAEAIEVIGMAIEQSSKQGRKTQMLENDLALYRAGRPLRMPVIKAGSMSLPKN